MNMADYDAMVNAYAECAIWSSSDYDDLDNPETAAPMDRHHSTDDLDVTAWQSFRADCEAFAEANASDLANMDAEQAGHDLWLTRNHHGTGFWDRGLGVIGHRLNNAANAFGECDLYVGDDGRVYAS